eukprot:XP_019926792.1 PREDICTED: uncharacterized protein LOC105337756 isoform X2 [Crassostrea gigas]
MKLKLNGIILIKAIFITILQAYTPIRRYHVVEGESGRYLGHTNAGSPYICHYFERGQPNTDLSNQCYDQNKEYYEDERVKMAYMYRGQSYPACPPLPKINNGYWKCPLGVFPNTVEVYASCAAQCFKGFTTNPTKEVVVRCPESLQWDNFADFQCIINNVGICQLWNLSFITSKPFQVIISWNVTTACQKHNFTFEMIGPKQNLTKRLQKNTTFMVIKDVDLDTTYEVFLYDQRKELASGKFRSAARVSPAKDHHAHQVNPTSVNITWEVPMNDSSVIGYMVNITDGDNWFTLNTSDTSLVVSRLETGKNYAITVAAFNQYSRSLLSEPVYIELPVAPTKVVHVHQVNTTTVHITWEAPMNNSSVIGFMVNITHGDNWFTLNTSDTSLVVSRLETRKNYTITVSAFNQNSISLQSEPVYIELQEKKGEVENNNDKVTTPIWIYWLVGVLSFAAIVSIILVVYYFKTCRNRRKRRIYQNSKRMIEIGTRLCCQNDNKAGGQVESNLEVSTCTSPLLDQQSHNLSNPSQESNTSPPRLDMKSLESKPDSLDLSEAASLNLDSISQGEETSGSPLRSDFENLGNSSNDIPKEVVKNVPKKWSKRGVSKKAPGSDSGQGSETGTCSTVSDGDDSPNTRSSQSSRNSRQMNYSHQDSVDSGRVSEGETGKESERPLIAEKVIPVGVLESCLTDISEKSVEQDSSVEIPVSVENELDPEECSCTFSNFISTVEPKHVYDLADLLDPHDHYGVKRSWKSLAEDVLNFDYSKIVAIEHRTKNTFEKVVLQQLEAEGKKLGHMVLHFSHHDHFRKDVLELIQKIHSECLFCDKIFANSLKDTFKK